MAGNRGGGRGRALRQNRDGRGRGAEPEAGGRGWGSGWWQGQRRLRAEALFRHETTDSSQQEADAGGQMWQGAEGES